MKKTNMKRRLICSICVCLLGLSALPVCGASGLDVQREQERALELDVLERAAEKAGGMAEYGESLDSGLLGLIKKGSSEAGGILRDALQSGAVLLICVMLCGLGEGVLEAAGGKPPVPISLGGALAVTAVSATEVESMLGLGRQTIENMASFASVLMPTVAAVTAATGAVSGAASRQLATVLFSDLLMNLIDKLLIPLVYGFLAVSVAYTSTGNGGLKRIAALLKWVATMLLTATMLGFTGYLTVSGVVAGKADAVAIKAAKFAISGSIPVVGGILSDAAETIIASAGVLKGAVGVFGMLTVLGVCMLPLLRIAAHYLVYKLVAALAAVMDSGDVGGLVDQIGSGFGLILGMTGSCCLLLLVSLVSSVAAVSV